MKVNGHNISDVRTYKLGNGIIQAVGTVDGKVLTMKYSAEAASMYGISDAKPFLRHSAEAASMYGISDAKPFLRQVREDLVHKYVDTYEKGGKVRRIVPTIKVDSDFLELLKAAGFDVIAGVVGLPYGVNVCITDMTQIDAINSIKTGIAESERLKAEAEKAERDEIKRLFEELIQDSKMA